MNKKYQQVLNSGTTENLVNASEQILIIGYCTRYVLLLPTK